MSNQTTGVIVQGIQYAADAIPAFLNSAAEQAGGLVKENPLPVAITTAILGLGSLFYLYKNSHSQRMARAASQLITANMNGYDNAHIIEALAKVPPENLQSVVAHAHSFITANMKEHDKAFIIETLTRVPPESLQNVVAHAHTFITDNMDGRDKARIIRALAHVPPENLQNFVTHAHSLITDNMDGHDKVSIIEALADTPLENLQNFVARANSFITANMDGHEKSSIIKTLTRVPPESLETFVVHANSFITDNMDGHDKVSIIEALAEGPPRNLQNVVARANTFIADNMNGDEKSSIIKTLTRVPPESLETFVAHAHTFITDNMNGLNKACIIKALADVPPENLQDFINQALRIITENTEDNFKTGIISLFSRLALQTNLNDFITPLLPLSNDMNEFEKPFFFISILMYTLNRLGMNIDLYVQELLPFINHNNKIQKLLMMAGLSLIDNARRAEIFEQFQAIDEEEKNHRMQRAVEQPLMQNLVELIAQANSENIGAFLINHETALKDTFFACLTTPAHVAEALDVHENNRDQKTRQAYELLQAHFQDTAIDIEANVAACLEYLGDPVIVNLHRHVLDGPNSPNDFGPFITEHPFVISDLEVDGREATALLWAYIQEIQNEVDKETALISLKGALTRCINNDGERICNPGKLQQLCVAVLQGSLPGVQIDDPVEPQAISTAHAMHLFFATPANQEHANWADLRAAAEVFLAHNPLVDGQEFMAEILEFATLQGIAGVPAPAQ